MPLEPVLDEIQRRGEETIKKIKKEAQEEADRIVEEAKREAEEILKKARIEAEKDGVALRKQEISAITLEMKRELLNRQKEIVEQVFDLLRQKVKNMDEATRKELIKKLLSKNSSPGMLVYSQKEDEKITKDVIKELKLDLKYAGNIECIGGVILDDPKGEIRINLTFDELLKQVYDQKLADVSKILFG